MYNALGGDYRWATQSVIEGAQREWYMERLELVNTIEALYGLCMSLRGRMVADGLILDQMGRMLAQYHPEAESNLLAAVDLQGMLGRRLIDNTKELNAFAARVEQFKNAMKVRETAY